MVRRQRWALPWKARPAQPGYAAGTMPLDTEGTGSFAAQTGAALSRVPRAPASRSELPCLGRPVRKGRGRIGTRPPALALSAGRPCREGAGDGGGAAGNMQSFIDVFEVGAYGSLSHAQAAADLGVGVPGGQQAQQLPLPGGEPGDGIAAPLGLQVGLAQVRAQQREHRPVPLGEIRPGPAVEVQPDVPLGPGAQLRGIVQAQLKLMLYPVGPVIVAVHAGAVPLPRGVEIRGFDDAAQVAGALGIAADLALPMAGPEALPQRRVPVPVTVVECFEFVVARNRDRLQDRIRLPPAVLPVEGDTFAADLVLQVGQQG